VRSSFQFDFKALDTDHDELRARKARLAGKLKELDYDSMFDTVTTQLREIDAELSDAATRLQAARAQMANTVTAVKISDLTERAAVASALKQRLIGVRFKADNRVEIESKTAVLTVIARDGGCRQGFRSSVAPGRQCVGDVVSGSPLIVICHPHGSVRIRCSAARSRSQANFGGISWTTLS
jgi:hypothetical protein